MLFAVVTAVFVGLLLVAEYKDSARGRWLTKPFASAAFIAAGVANHAPVWILVGLVLSAIGDVLLIRKSTFLAGVGAFLLAHVAYAVAFSGMGISALRAGGAAVPIGIAAILVARVLMPKVERAMKIPIGVYMVVVSAMLALAIGTRNPRIAIGAAMFWASDLAVARDTFLKRGFINRLWGLPLYYAAQIVLGGP